MTNNFKIISKNIEDTSNIAFKLSDFFQDNGGLVCLHGDIGAGKTALTSLCAKYLDVKEHVTSPSFVILNEYHSGKKDIYHFDLYRLENEGLKSILDELREYSNDKNAITFVEWAEFSQGELDIERLEIHISYISDTERELEFINCNFTNEENFKKLKEALL